MSNLYIETVSLNANNGYHMGSPVFEETKYTNMGELYRALVKEYGRCSSKLYIGDVSGKSVQIGWVFQKRVYYSDLRLNKSMRSLNASERDFYTFIKETQVSVHTAKSTTTVINHFAKF